jgi:hypothetical protein
VCPQCGSAAAVHTIAEWAAMAQGQMTQQWQPGAPTPGYPAGPGPQSGFPAGPGPQSGFPDPSQYQQSGFPDPSQYQQSGFPDPSQYQWPPSPAEPPPVQQPGYQTGPPPAPHPGNQAGPTPAEPWQSQPPPRRTSGWDSTGDATSFEEGIADAVLGAATKAIGRAIGSRMRRAYNERVVPAMAARQEAMLQQRTAIAERHPDLRACLNDQVVFLAGGTRVLPLASALAVRTVEQSDALVAQLRG